MNASSALCIASALTKMAYLLRHIIVIMIKRYNFDIRHTRLIVFFIFPYKMEVFQFCVGVQTVRRRKCLSLNDKRVFLRLRIF